MTNKVEEVSTGSSDNKNMSDVSPAVEVDINLPQNEVKFYHKSSFACSLCDEPNVDKSGRIVHAAGADSSQSVGFWEIDYLSQIENSNLRFKKKTLKEINGCKKTDAPNWKVGDSCVAQWTEDECWYRAVITSITSNEKVLEQFIDYGNSDYTKLDHLKPSETKIGGFGELLSEDGDLRKSSGESAKHISQNPTSEAIESHETLKSQPAKVWKEGDCCVTQWNGFWHKSIITKIEDDKVMVKFTDFGNCGYTTQGAIMPPETEIDEEGQIGSKDVQQKKKDGLNLKPFDNQDIKEPKHENWKVGDKCVAQWIEDHCWYKSCIVKIEKIESPEQVLVKFIEFGNEDFTSLNSLKPFNTPISPDGQLIAVATNTDKWKEGDKCVAQWSEDHLWYKSVISKIESNEKVLVQFIEYGNQDYTSIDNLKPFETIIGDDGEILNAASVDGIDEKEKIWKEGDKCVAQWKEDNLWYKSVITKIESSEKVLVCFTDYGNSDYTSFEDLKPHDIEIDEDGNIKEVANDKNETEHEVEFNGNETWKVGDKCVAQWTEDENWYKSRIIDIETTGKVLVEFSEYGNSDYTSLSLLKPFNTEIVDGLLINVESIKDKNDERSVEKSANLTEETAFWNVGDECVAKWNEDLCWYKSIIKKIENENKVLVQFIDFGNADYTSLSNLKSFETTIFNDGQIEHTIPKNGSEKIELQKEISEQWKVGDECVAQWSEDHCWYKSKISKIESKEKVYVEFTEYGNSDFTTLCNLKPFKTKIYEDGQIEQDEKKYNDKNESKNSMPLNYSWKEGDLCVSQWKEDGLWYHSKITKIDSPGEVQVLFTEYGNSDLTSIDLLKSHKTLISDDGQLVISPEVISAMPEFSQELQKKVDLPAENDITCKWNVGDLCVAQWKEDGLWYKSKISKIDSYGQVEVTFTEYGNSDYTSIKLLKPHLTLIGEDGELVDQRSNELFVAITEELLIKPDGDHVDTSANSSYSTEFKPLLSTAKSIKDENFIVTLGDEDIPEDKEVNSRIISNENLCVATGLHEQTEPVTNESVLKTPKNDDKSPTEDEIEKSTIKVNCESYVEESLCLDSSSSRYINDCSDVNKSEIEFINRLVKDSPVKKSSKIICPIIPSHLDNEYNDLASPCDLVSQFNMCQIDGNTSVSLIDFLLKKPKVGDGQSVSAPQTRPLSPDKSPISLPSNTGCIFQGRVKCFAITDQGAQYLEALTNQETVFTIQEELMTDGVKFMLHPVATKVIQAVVDITSNLEEILEVVLNNFNEISSDRAGSKVVQKVLARLGSDQKQAVVAKLENHDLLTILLHSQHGTNLAQACLPYLEGSTVSFIANFLFWAMVDIGTNPNGSYFIQLFLTNSNSNITKAIKDQLMDGIVKNVDHLVKDKFGTWLVQTAVKVSETARHVFQFSQWVKDNLLDVYCDPYTMGFAASVIEALVKFSNEEEENVDIIAIKRESEKILREVMFLMTDTLVLVRHESVPLIVAASIDPYGHVLARDVCIQARDVLDLKNKFIEVFSQYKSNLEDDVFGCLVLKGLQGLL